jgi:hypothetical protein
MEERTWRDAMGRVGLVLFIADVVAYVGHLLAYRFFYAKHVDVLVAWELIGFVINILALVLSAIGRRKKFAIPITIACIVLAYLWFSSIAWWALVK